MNNSGYGMLNMNALRRELKNRGAKVSGTKQKLIERLQDYDRNKNFVMNAMDVSFDDLSSIVWPEENVYNSVNMNIFIPNFDIVNVNMYFIEMYKGNEGMSEYAVVHRKGYNMMMNVYLLALVTFQTSDRIFFRGQVHSENTKALTYFTKIAIKLQNGYIEQSVCECVAGKGPRAICKHVAVICYAILRYKEHNEWRIKKTPTQEKQIWHAPKKSKLDISPKKAHELTFEIKALNSFKRKKHNMCYDPRPDIKCPPEEWRTSVRNEVINYSCMTKKYMGINGIIESARMKDIVHDHDYLALPLHHQHVMNKISVSPDEAKFIETNTKSQAGCKMWHSERALRITASHVGDICKFTENRDQSKFAENIVSSKPIRNPALEWGKSKEITAIEAYEAMSHNKVEKCGFFISPNYSYIGASPDGLIGSETVLEVKCPFSIKDDFITPLNYPHVEYVGNELRLKQTSNYYYQVQTQLFVTGRSYCDFFVWTNCDEKRILVNRNNDAIFQIIIPRVNAFYFKFMLPTITQKFYGLR